MSKYIHRYTPWWKGGGGGGSYDDTAIKRRITALESGKQNVLVGGDGIILLNDTISAVNILNDTRESSTTVWSSNKVKSLFDTLQGQVDIVITPTKPAKSSAVNKTMYYVGTESPYHIWFFVNDDYTDFGTTELDLSNYFTKAEINELLELKVDKVVGKSLVLDTDIAQITTNKNDIANIKDDETITSFSKVKLEFDNKVDKVTGKSLVLDTDITQITTNKTDIATLKTDKQDKITDSTLSSISDSTTVSSVSASSKTNKTFALSKLWTWITGKLSTSISSSSTDTQIPSAKAVYTDAIKPTNKTGDSALVISNNTGLTNGNDYASNVIRRLIVVGKMAFFTCHLKYTASAVGANWTDIGTVPAGLRPANRTSVVAMVYNNGANESAGGNINTTGIISLWTNAKTAGSNYQVRVSACWEIA